MLDNAGLVWNNRDLRALRYLINKGETIKYVARFLKRSPLACESMYREIRRMEMMQNGGPDEDLRSWAKKK
jgi:hypothetical protein